MGKNGRNVELEDFIDLNSSLMQGPFLRYKISYFCRPEQEKRGKSSNFAVKEAKLWKLTVKK